MKPLLRFLVAISALYAMGALTLLIAGWLDRWPRLKEHILKLGEAACTFALGLMGFLIVVVVLRALGWIPSR